jgi:hypothetical protein
MLETSLTASRSGSAWRGMANGHSGILEGFQIPPMIASVRFSVSIRSTSATTSPEWGGMTPVSLTESRGRWTTEYY